MRHLAPAAATDQNSAQKLYRQAGISSVSSMGDRMGSGLRP